MKRACKLLRFLSEPYAVSTIISCGLYELLRFYPRLRHFLVYYKTVCTCTKYIEYFVLIFITVHIRIKEIKLKYYIAIYNHDFIVYTFNFELNVINCKLNFKK